MRLFEHESLVKLGDVAEVLANLERSILELINGPEDIAKDIGYEFTHALEELRP